VLSLQGEPPDGVHPALFHWTGPDGAKAFDLAQNIWQGVDTTDIFDNAEE
jgi:hypothetical protein